MQEVKFDLGLPQEVLAKIKNDSISCESSNDCVQSLKEIDSLVSKFGLEVYLYNVEDKEFFFKVGYKKDWSDSPSEDGLYLVRFEGKISVAEYVKSNMFPVSFISNDEPLGLKEINGKWLRIGTLTKYIAF